MDDETTPNEVDEQERRIREEQAGAGSSEGDDKGHDDTPDDTAGDEGAELQEGEGDTDAP